MNFRCARSDCPDCQAPLKVKKTRSKTVHTLLLGALRARETLLHCERCRNPVDYPSETLGRLAPAGCRFGYDVIVFIGRAYFLEHRRTEEIRDRLRSRNVRISAGEIEYLAKKFVVCPALAHRQSAPRLKAAMSAQGGYILHLDACHRGWKNMIAQIEKYWEKLFADPITVHTSEGSMVIQPQRTNNLMERFFRDLRRGARRKSGHNSMGKRLKGMIADTPLVQNLENPDYLKVLLDGHATLEACFAHVDINLVRQELNAAQKSVEKVPGPIRRLIATPKFPSLLGALFQKSA